MISGIGNHGNPSHYDLHIKNFNSNELKFLIEYQYKYQFHGNDLMLISNDSVLEQRIPCVIEPARQANSHLPYVLHKSQSTAPYWYI